MTLRPPYDEWYYTGAKATYGTFNDAALAAGDPASYDGVGLTDFTDTTHGLVAPSLLYIQNTTNYNGLKKIYSVPDANSMQIYAPFVAETTSSATWKTMFTYDRYIPNRSDAGKSVQAGPQFEFLGFEVTLASAGGDVENLTVIVDANKGAAWDTKIYAKAMSGIQYINYMLDVPRRCDGGDKIDIAWANAGAILWGIKIFTRRLV